jgi:hypothetical protein
MFRYHYLENLPEVFSNYISRNDEIHHYNTRTSTTQISTTQIL